MKYAKLIPAILLGLLFTAFGAMYLLGKTPQQEMSEGAKAFFNLFGPTGYMQFIKVCEVLFGILLLIPKTRALGLVLIAPIVVNIVCYEIFIEHKPGIGIALLVVNAIGLYLNKDKYLGMLKA